MVKKGLGEYPLNRKDIGRLSTIYFYLRELKKRAIEAEYKELEYIDIEALIEKLDVASESLLDLSDLVREIVEEF